MPFDINEAIQLGQVLQAAYEVPAGDLTQRAGELIPTQYDPFSRGYTILSTIYGNDLITDWNPSRGANIVSYGYVVQDEGRNLVIVVRGTEGIAEWMHDAAFLQKPYPFMVGAGMTEDGFTTVYEHLSVDPGLQLRLADCLASLPIRAPIESISICGHSLGGALVTLLALELYGKHGVNPSVYTYASPRTGDDLFAATYDALIPETYRIANQLDLVPKLPLADPGPLLPHYQHVGRPVSLNPFGLALKVAVTFRCEHLLTNYQYLLTEIPGIVIAPDKLPVIEPSCVLELLGVPLLLR
jgi:hypothetical protein